MKRLSNIREDKGKGENPNVKTLVFYTYLGGSLVL